MIVNFFLTVMNIGLVALNLTLFYTAGGHWWSMAAAVFAATGAGWCAAFGIASRTH